MSNDREDPRVDTRQYNRAEQGTGRLAMDVAAMGQANQASRGRYRHGSQVFYRLLDEAADTHNSKSHDYARNGDPFANYRFAGMMSRVFNNEDDSGFIGRIGEKIYRLANLENGNKEPMNESVEDTEKDIFVIVGLWVAMRRERRMNKYEAIAKEKEQVAQSRMVEQLQQVFGQLDRKDLFVLRANLNKRLDADSESPSREE